MTTLHMTLTEDFDWGEFTGLPKASPLALKKLAGETDDTALLEGLAKHFNDAVRAAVGANPSTPRWVLSQLAKDESHEVRWMVAENPHTNKSILEDLSKDENSDRWILEALAMREDNSVAMLKRLCKRLSMHSRFTCFCENTD